MLNTIIQAATLALPRWHRVPFGLRLAVEFLALVAAMVTLAAGGACLLDWVMP
jgi:hypothetical protein